MSKGVYGMELHSATKNMNNLYQFHPGGATRLTLVYRDVNNGDCFISMGDL